MTTYNQGDVVLLPFPFTDPRTNKHRPAVVVSADWFNHLRADCVLVAITSQVPPHLDQDEFLLSASDLTSAGLPKPSIVKLGKIATIEKKLIIKSLGKLPSSTLTNVINGLQNLLH